MFGSLLCSRSGHAWFLKLSGPLLTTKCKFTIVALWLRRAFEPSDYTVGVEFGKTVGSRGAGKEGKMSVTRPSPGSSKRRAVVCVGFTYLEICRGNIQMFC